MARLKVTLLFFLSIFKIVVPNEENVVWLNIFVHGIIKIPFYLSDYRAIMDNKVEGSKYYYGVQYLRESSDFYLNQPMQEMGLFQINSDDKYEGNGALAVALIHEEQNKILSKEKNLYYTFGWSGLLSRFHREEEAKDLYSELSSEVERLKKEGVNPKIRLVAWSHGGNLILNMANLICDHKYNFYVDELIMLGTPIQKETDVLTDSPLFKKIYNFYSMSDIAQKVDLISTQHLFCHRRFADRRDFSVPDKIVQVQTRVTSIEYDCKDRIKRAYHMDPKHNELWKFRWIDSNYYRAKFPLCPFPLVVFIPLIINNIKNCFDFANNIILDIKPSLEKMVIEDADCKDKCEAPFYCCEELDQFKKIVEHLEPACFTKNDKAELVKNAMLYAVEQI